MIKDFNNNKITANQKAKEIIISKLVDLDWSWCDESCGYGDEQGMSDKEIENVSNQIKKRLNSIHTLLGYEKTHNIY